MNVHLTHFIVPVIHRISSLDTPELQPYRTLRRPEEHLSKGIFIAEGSKVVQRLLASHLPVVSLLVTEEWLQQLSSETPPARLPDDIFVADKNVLETIVGFRMHQGVMAVAKVPFEPDLDQLIASSPSPRFLAALDGLVFAENVGVIVRNCAAFGVQGILVGETSASPYLRRAVRNSMGTVFHMPVIHTANLSDTLSAIRLEHTISVIVADAHTTANLYDIDYRQDTCIVFGNEDTGVSASVKAVATNAVRIPMKEGIDSLNVASASAVMLGEVARQRLTS